MRPTERDELARLAAESNEREKALEAERERLILAANSARVLIERHRATRGSNDLLDTAIRELGVCRQYVVQDREGASTLVRRPGCADDPPASIDLFGTPVLWTCPTRGCEVSRYTTTEPGFCSLCLHDLVIAAAPGDRSGS